MELMLFMVTGVSVIAVCVCINAASQELRCIRTVMETHANLVPVKVQAYERQRPDGIV